MRASDAKEVWLRGPLPGIHPTLQPVAHALMQAREEVNELMQDFPDALLWEKPAGVASPGFHMMHLAGVLDRLFTYAKGQTLTDEQFSELERESHISPDSKPALLDRINRQVDKSLIDLENLDVMKLTESRGVGRDKLPSTVLGLLVHSAEHTMRHVGQLSVTVRVILDAKTRSLFS